MRTYLVLKALSQAESYLSLNYFIDRLQVSKRTVQGELAFIKRAGKRHGFALNNTYGKGYSLEVKSKEALEDYLKVLASEETVLNDEQLVISIISVLLSSHHQFVTANQLAQVTGVSSGSLYTKMDTVDNFVESFHLKLERKSHYGVRLLGTSRAKRQLMLELYLKGDNRLKHLVDERAGNFDEYERIAEDCIREHRLRIGFYEFQVLMAWLKTMVLHETTRFPVQTPYRLGHVSHMSHCVMSQVFDEVITSFQISATPELQMEFEDLVKHAIQNDSPVKAAVDKVYLQSKISDFFNATDLMNHTTYSQDDTFIAGLVTHLSFLLERISEKITYKNPLLLELCIRYPMIFDLVLKFARFLENVFNIHVSNDELGFIAIHFLNHEAIEHNNRIKKYERIAVICTTGGGVSNLIRTQIIGIFPQATVKAISFWEKECLISFKPDLIFSVVPLKSEPKVPTLYIKTLLTKQDIENIKQVLCISGAPDNSPTEIKVPKQFLNLIKAPLFHVTQTTSYNQLIQTMAQEMMDQGYGDSNFKQNVVKREAYMSTIYNNGIAMPHPLEMKGNQSAIAVAVVTANQNEADKAVKLVFMVCLAHKDFHFYSSIANSIFQLMQSKEKINEVYTHPSLVALVNTLKEMDESTTPL